MELILRTGRKHRRKTQPTRPDASFWGSLWGLLSSSGERVTPESAMALSAYFAAIRNISEDTAKLPVDVGRRVGKDRREIGGHQVWLLMNHEANREMSSGSFREVMNGWAMGWGNGIAEIEWNHGLPVALWPIHPSRVELKRRQENNELYYRIINHNGPFTELEPRNVFHLHGFGDDGIQGYSVAIVGAESMGRGLAVQKYGGTLFRGGGMDRIALEHPDEIGETALDNLRRSWVEAYGGASNYRPVVLEEGAKVSRIGIPPKDAQMIEAGEFTVTDIARWCRCPPQKLYQFLRAQGWSTLEQLNISYATDSIGAWTGRWEQEIRRKLFTADERTSGFYVRHNFGALMRGDSAAQAEFFRKMREMGVYSVNDVRELMDRDPIGPEGNVRHVPVNWAVLGSDYVPTMGSVPDEAIEAEPEPEVNVQEQKEKTQEESELSYAYAVDAVTESYNRLNRKQIKAIRAAIKRRYEKNGAGAFRKWSDAFYDRLRREAFDALAPPMRVAFALKGETNAEEKIKNLCDGYISWHKLNLTRAVETGGNAPERLMSDWEKNHGGLQLMQGWRKCGQRLLTGAL